MTPEEIAQLIGHKSAKEQDAFLAEVKKNFSEEDYKVIAAYIGFVSLFASPKKYFAMKDAFVEEFAEEFFRSCNK